MKVQAKLGIKFTTFWTRKQSYTNWEVLMEKFAQVPGMSASPVKQRGSSQAVFNGRVLVLLALFNPPSSNGSWWSRGK